MSILPPRQPSRRDAAAFLVGGLLVVPTSACAMQGNKAVTEPVVRVSILRCAPERFAELRRMMADAQSILEPGIRAMPGLLDYLAGADEATSSLSNVSVWRTLADAEAMGRFQPMLDLGKRFAEAGASFDRPIMNYATLWRIEDAPQ